MTPLLRGALRILIILAGLAIGAYLVRVSGMRRAQKGCGMCGGRGSVPPTIPVEEGFQVTIPEPTTVGVPASLSSLTIQYRCQTLRNQLAAYEKNPEPTMIAGIRAALAQNACDSVPPPPFPVENMAEPPKVPAETVAAISKELKESGVTA